MVRIWVYPEFATKIKKEALDNNKNIIEYTKILAGKEKKEKSVKYEFNF